MKMWSRGGRTGWVGIATFTAVALVASMIASRGVRPVVGATPTRGGTLIMSVKYNPTTVDPQKAKTITDDTILSLMAETLVKWEDGKFVGVLASRWDVSPDGAVYTFHLRSGAKFQDGQPLTAAAVAASLARMTDPANPLPRAANLTAVEQVQPLDPATVRIKLKAPDPDFLGELINIYIIDAAAAKNLGPDQAPSGTGPFKLAAYVPDQQLTFTKFAAYWGGEPYLDRIVVRIIPNADTQEVELQAGTIDFMDYVPPKDVTRLRTVGARPIPYGRVNWARIVFNLKTVSDVRLRQAVCYAFDRNAVLQDAYYGLGTPQYTIALQGSWAYDAEISPYRFDPARARGLLDEAGWKLPAGGSVRERDGKPLVLNFPSRGDAEWLLSTQMIQQMLRNVGVDTRITTAAPATYYNEVRTGQYDLAWWLSNAAPEPPIAASLLDSHQFWNTMQVRLPEVDSLVEQAQSTTERKARTADYFALQKIHHDQALECLGFWTKQVYATSAKVQGMTIDPTGIPLHPALWWKSQ